MAGLPRVAAVYRLLERMRVAEAAAAAAEVAEVDRRLAETEASRTAGQARRSAHVADAVARSSAEVELRAAGVRSTRLRSLLETRRKRLEEAELVAADSRLRVRQVEEVIAAERQAEQTMETRRAQADADERFLAQRFHRS